MVLKVGDRQTVCSAESEVTRMKKVGVFSLGVLAALALLAAPSVAVADTLVGAGGWQAVSGFTVNQNGTPYWDGDSVDSTGGCNIGYLLLGTAAAGCGPLPTNPGATNLQFWGNADGSASLDMSFNKTAPADNVALLIEIAGNATANEFGWYDTASPYNRTAIFPGSATGGAAFVLNPGVTSYGFYFQTPDGRFFTQEVRQDSDAGNMQHFAIFRQSNLAETYWIGMEDLDEYTGTGGTSDWDYNDISSRSPQFLSQARCCSSAPA